MQSPWRHPSVVVVVVAVEEGAVAPAPPHPHRPRLPRPLLHPRRLRRAENDDDDVVVNDAADAVGAMADNESDHCGSGNCW